MTKRIAQSLMVILVTSMSQFAQQAKAQDSDLISNTNIENEFKTLDFERVIPARPLRPIRPIKPRPIPLCNIDPAAQSLNFQILYKTAQFRGRVRITGVIKNNGRLRYVSGSNQQVVYLYENRTLVASRPFQNLELGQTVNVSFDRNWDASSPSEGEFPPEYMVVIGYDPDIYLDSNSQNDDCSTANNQIKKSGSGINALF
jgi:hypothetical protein